MKAEDIRQKMKESPQMRARDLADSLGISEAELVAAQCGTRIQRLNLDVAGMMSEMPSLGTVMCLTRNESAVHEKIGPFEKVMTGKSAGLVLGEQIDLRYFHQKWAHVFAVSTETGQGLRHSLQFFDAQGQAVHKIHMRDESDMAAYQAFCQKWRSEDQSDTLEIAPAEAEEDRISPANLSDQQLAELRERWQAMTDVHQYTGIIRDYHLSRYQAVDIVGDDLAWEVQPDSVHQLFAQAVATALPIMCFVGNKGMIQIHTGAIQNTKIVGPWLNVLDDTFHLHLKVGDIDRMWAVRKANSDGYVTSVEAYDKQGNLVIQFFGKRIEGTDEREDWRALVADLPLLSDTRKAS